MLVGLSRVSDHRSLSYLLIKSFLHSLSVRFHPLSCANTVGMRCPQPAWQAWVNMGPAPGFNPGGSLGCQPPGRNKQCMSWTPAAGMDRSEWGSQHQWPRCWKWETSCICWPGTDTAESLGRGLVAGREKSPSLKCAGGATAFNVPWQKSCKNIRIAAY